MAALDRGNFVEEAKLASRMILCGGLLLPWMQSLLYLSSWLLHSCYALHWFE